ncbi:hypothetical protein [Pararhodobacter zhoushanensis]|uniref:hypothetical protein n=1 Tax=Pararhodobacter zhoushanensis TaxID=2479545 RepID=UPI0029CAB187|nr:hypothetical protein [Pararhodobacter zhoushanensis]
MRSVCIFCSKTTSGIEGDEQQGAQHGRDVQIALGNVEPALQDDILEQQQTHRLVERLAVDRQTREARLAEHLDQFIAVDVDGN